MEPDFRREPCPEAFDRLRKRRPNELVAARREGHDQHPALSTNALVDDRPHRAEVDLRLLSERRIVDAHGHARLTPSELVVREASQRRVADLDSLAQAAR
jgi:hypothetical protein